MRRFHIRTVPKNARINPGDVLEIPAIHSAALTLTSEGVLEWAGNVISPIHSESADSERNRCIRLQSSRKHFPMVVGYLGRTGNSIFVPNPA